MGIRIVKTLRLNLFQHFLKHSPLKKVQGYVSPCALSRALFKNFCLFFLLTSAPLPLLGASNFSLLFKPHEIDIIREHLHGGGDIDSFVPAVAMEAISLSAIMFMDAGNWTLWLNDQIIHAGEFLENFPFQIQNVTPHQVTFSWTPPNSPPQTFTLRAGQLFHPGNGHFQEKDPHSIKLER